MTHHHATIIFFEEDSADFHLVSDILGEINNRIQIMSLSNHRQIEDYLSSFNNGQSAPDLFISNTNVAGFRASQLLLNLKKNPHFENIPFIVLTADSHESNLVDCYKVGATAVLFLTSDHMDLKYKLKTLLQEYNLL